MKIPSAHSRVSGPRLLLCLSIAALLPACQEKPEAAAPPDATPETPVVLENALDAPTGLLARHTDAPVHWQSWSGEAFELARKSDRLVLAMVASDLYPGSAETFRWLYGQPAIVRNLNTRFVPVLVDANRHREVALLCHLLAREIRRPVGFPFLIWFTADAAPIAWTPMPSEDPDQIAEVFQNSSTMVSRIWNESPDYVKSNALQDLQNRRERVQAESSTSASGELPDPEVSLRALLALYDEGSQQIDGSGGLVPMPLLRYLTVSAGLQGLPQSLRDQASIAAVGVGRSILRSAMVDPLDGGVYFARRGVEWDLPIFTRDLSTQAAAASAFFELHRLTGDAEFLVAAERTLDFVENRLALESGGYGFLETFASNENPDRALLWTEERLEEVLEADELRVVEAVAGTRGLGNISMVSDPRREFFRQNSLAKAHLLQDVAPTLGVAPEQAERLWESATAKLLAARAEAVAPMIDETVVTTSVAEMAAAYATGYAVTRKEGYRGKAVGILEFLHDQYYDDAEGLWRVKHPSGGGVRARGIDYALTARVALEVYHVTADRRWLDWAVQLVREARERLEISPGIVAEAPAAEDPLDLALVDHTMIFGNSTIGTLHSVVRRLAIVTGDDDWNDFAATLAGTWDLGGTLSPVVRTDFHTGEILAQRAPKIPAPSAETAFPANLLRHLPNHGNLVTDSAEASPPPGDNEGR